MAASTTLMMLEAAASNNAPISQRKKVNMLAPGLRSRGVGDQPESDERCDQGPEGDVRALSPDFS